uniref:Tetraspanin n=1 Tax=Poecilia latipinna TaxID=48699 RepID=A0A3B3TQB9_9TELE
METQRKKKNTCGTICLKYLLFLFNICFWLAGGAVLAVGVWTLVDKSDYVSLLNSGFYSASAFILIVAGVIVTLTGIIGCCATLNEKRSLLIVYLVLLLCVFLLEITAGVLAYVYQQQVNLALHTVTEVRTFFKCCGSHNFSDWRDSEWIRGEGTQQLVPDSCCKTLSSLCGRRDHPSNIYRVEGGCVEKLEDYIRSQLYILGGVGVGIAFLQLVGMMFTCCLCRNLKEDLY